jgi:DNA-binding winged helix-turn-helix (wHTH) protein
MRDFAHQRKAMMETLIKDRSKIKNYSLIIEDRTLKLNHSQKTIKLSKNQAKLLLCLINEIQDKHSIIHYIWGGGNAETNESSYRQLVRRTRALLATNGFPADAIVTIPNYGLCINNKLVNDEPISHRISVRLYNDHAVL